MDLIQPQIIEETSDYAVVFKPPKMHSTFLHSVPYAQKNVDTLLEWYIENGLAVSGLPDGGLMHRLDFETHGLVLFAKNQKSYEFFKDLQDRGEFVKEYSAICVSSESSSVPIEGFPPPPDINLSSDGSVPKIIMSYFRPYGQGRKQVRPVINDKTQKEVAKDNGSFYRTEITVVNGNVFTVRIRRGFRHQIRCHLSWIGCPILNDPLYGSFDCLCGDSPMALRAYALLFVDPSTSNKRECRIKPLNLTDR